MKKYLIYIILIILASALIQFLLISYKHFVGYVIITSPSHFFSMIITGTVLTSIMMLLCVLMNIKMINILERGLPWKENFYRHIAVEMGLSFIVGGFVGSLFTFISYLFWGYKQSLNEVIVSNFLIAAIINLIIVSTMEAINYFRKYRENQLKAEILEKENVTMRFLMLKQQLDPHFLFNSLNILSSLISKNKQKAQEFIDVFVSMYRYTLDVIEEPVVKVEDELKFTKDYLFLQKLRFDDAFTFEINIDEKWFAKLIPPLALQMLVENCFKHNVASSNNPLYIKITCDENRDLLIVKNNIQPKKRISERKGIGLENLKSRYKLISDFVPEFEIVNENYFATLPLIKSE